MSKNISTIKAKISRLGINGNLTKLYDLLVYNEKNNIENDITYLIDEHPILCYYLNRDYWWVITNVRLIIGGKVKGSHFYNDIVSFKVDDIFETGITNQACNQIQVILNNGSIIDLNLEKNTWFSILNLLKFLITK